MFLPAAIARINRGDATGLGAFRPGIFGRRRGVAPGPFVSSTRALRLAACLVAVAALCAAQPRRHYYYVTYTFSGAGAKVITVQQQASDAKNVRGSMATIEMAADCALTVETNGTAATATAATATAPRPQTSLPPAVDVFTASDVGAGTVHTNWTARANVPLPLNLEDIELKGDGTGTNFSIRTADCDTAGTINLKWEEW
jgi:hypothetical protein